MNASFNIFKDKHKVAGDINSLSLLVAHDLKPSRKCASLCVILSRDNILYDIFWSFLRKDFLKVNYILKI